MPVTVVNPDPVMAETDVGVARIISASTSVVPWNPAMPGMAVVPRHPHPIVPFVPITAAVIVRPISNADREIDRLRLRRQWRCYRDDRREQNQNFSFHTLI